MVSNLFPHWAVSIASWFFWNWVSSCSFGWPGTPYVVAYLRLATIHPCLTLRGWDLQIQWCPVLTAFSCLIHTFILKPFRKQKCCGNSTYWVTLLTEGTKAFYFLCWWPGEHEHWNHCLIELILSFLCFLHLWFMKTLQDKFLNLRIFQ